MSFIKQFQKYSISLLTNGVKLPKFYIPKKELEKRGFNYNISDYEFLLALCLEGLNNKIDKNNNVV